VTELSRVLSEPGSLFRLVARHWLDGDPDVIRSLARATVPVQFGAVVRAISVVSSRRNPKATALSIYALIHGFITLRLFEDSLTRRPVVSRSPASMAEFALRSLLPEVDWAGVRAHRDAADGRKHRGRG
jgi:hypothetical protein